VPPVAVCCGGIRWKNNRADYSKIGDAQVPLHTFLRNFPVDEEAANFLWTCYGLVTDLSFMLWTCCWLVVDLLRGNWGNGLWPCPIFHWIGTNTNLGRSVPVQSQYQDRCIFYHTEAINSQFIVCQVVVHHGDNSWFRNTMFLHYLISMACISLE